MAGSQRSAAVTLSIVLTAFAVLILAAASANVERPVSRGRRRRSRTGRHSAGDRIGPGGHRAAAPVRGRPPRRGRRRGGAGRLRLGRGGSSWKWRCCRRSRCVSTYPSTRRSSGSPSGPASLRDCCSRSGPRSGSPGSTLPRPFATAPAAPPAAPRSRAPGASSWRRKSPSRSRCSPARRCSRAASTRWRRSTSAFPRAGLIALDFDVEPSAPSPEMLPGLAREALDRAAAVPGVVAAAMSNRAPIDSSTPAVSVSVPGSSSRPVDDVTFYLATERYFETVGLAIVRGRAFNAGEVAREADVAIVNQTLAQRLWPDGDAIDRALLLQPAGPHRPHRRHRPRFEIPIALGAAAAAPVPANGAEFQPGAPGSHAGRSAAGDARGAGGARSGGART